VPKRFILASIMARPTKLTKALIATFREKTLLGLPRTKVCDLLHIDYTLFYMWLRLAEEVRAGTAAPVTPACTLDRNMVVEFSQMVRDAEAQWQEAMLAKMHIDPHWQREMTLLERRDPAHWRKQETLQVTDQVPTSPDDLSDEQLAAIAKREG